MIHPSIEGGIARFSGANDDGSWKIGQILTIGKIINHKGECVDSLTLEPQGIAHLVSAECVHLPEGVCGLAHVLTRVCNEGLLTLNIGVVDPGWKNNLSTPVLNFSSEKRLLQVGQSFIRITFHEIDVWGGAKGSRHPSWSQDDYVRDIRARAVGSFGKNFLNIKQLVGQASKKENARFKEAMLKYLPIGAFSLAFFALMVTVGVASLARFALNREGGAELQQLERVMERRHNETLQRLDAIESRQRAVSVGGTASVQTGARQEKPEVQGGAGESRHGLVNK